MSSTNNILYNIDESIAKITDYGAYSAMKVSEVNSILISLSNYYCNPEYNDDKVFEITPQKIFVDSGYSASEAEEPNNPVFDSIELIYRVRKSRSISSQEVGVITLKLNLHLASSHLTNISSLVYVPNFSLWKLIYNDNVDNISDINSLLTMTCSELKEVNSD